MSQASRTITLREGFKGIRNLVGLKDYVAEIAILKGLVVRQQRTCMGLATTRGRVRDRLVGNLHLDLLIAGSCTRGRARGPQGLPS